MRNIKLYIVEDEYLLAKSQRLNLELLGYQILGTSNSFTDCVHEITDLKPELILIDISKKGGKNGIALANLINDNFGLPFIFITSHFDKETLQQAKRAKPFGYLLNPFEKNEIVIAIEIALNNHMIRKNQSCRSNNISADSFEKLNLLTEREKEIIKQLLEGHNNPQIADLLYISRNTVEQHKKNIYKKLKINNLGGIVKFARDVNLF